MENNSNLTHIERFFENENDDTDISYQWSNKDQNVRMLCNKISVNAANISKILQRDFSCEFKV